MTSLVTMLRLFSVACVVVVLLQTAAGANPPVIGNVDQATREQLVREMKERREAIQRRRAQEDLRAFVNQDGVLTLTNRLGKYRRDPEYTEIQIDYEPIVVAPKYRGYTTPAHYDQSAIERLVAEYARQYGLEESLIFAVIRVESNGNPNAVSHAGASGLMQLMPGTAKEMGVTDIFNPAQNIAGGTQYLSKLLKLFDGDMRLALAGYNAGPQNVIRYEGIPPFRETQNYVRDVFHWWRVYNNTSARPEYLYGAPKSLEAYQQEQAPPPAEPPQTPQMASHQAEDEDTTRQMARADLDGPAEYTIHFTNGTSQPADRVIPGDDHYYIQYQGVTKRVRKEHVDTIS